MRLPESVTKIAPVGEVISASEAGEALLEAAVAGGNNRLLVSDADESGLSRWEKDFGLADGTGESADKRRARLRGARAGGQTLTREKICALAVNVGSAAEGEVSESFATYSAVLSVIGDGRLPSEDELEAVADAVERQKGAHLSVTLAPYIGAYSERGETRHGGTLTIMWAAVVV